MHLRPASRLALVLSTTVALACAGDPGDPGMTGASATSTADATTSDATSSSASMSSTSQGSTTAGVSGTQSTGGTGGTGTSTSTGTTEGSSDATGDGCIFIPCVDGGVDCVVVPGLDGVPRCSMCDVWAQDCPEGEKCSAWANDGGESWNATICVPVGEDKPGEPCTAEGSPLSGHDSCVLGAMCWDVDPETLEGTCVGLCDGSEDAPTCAEPLTACAIINGGALNLCLPTCDPFLQDCDQTESCVDVGEGVFHCVPVGEDPGGYGEPCEFIAACDHGLACIQAAEVPGCMASGCCSPYCQLSEPNTCPGMPEQSCVPWFDEGEAPAGLEDLGVCAIP